MGSHSSLQGTARPEDVRDRRTPETSADGCVSAQQGSGSCPGALSELVIEPGAGQPVRAPWCPPLPLGQPLGTWLVPGFTLHPGIEPALPFGSHRLGPAFSCGP